MEMDDFGVALSSKAMVQGIGVTLPLKSIIKLIFYFIFLILY